MRHFATRRSMCGQALTELSIAAAAVLVPLFLFIPLIGKLIDMQQATVQAARYEAWEHTVWLSSAGERKPGFKPFASGVKSPTVVRNEAANRFFGDTARVFTIVDKAVWTPDAATLNPAWFSHRGDPLVASSFPAGRPAADFTMTTNDATPPTALPILSAIGKLVDLVNAVLGPFRSFASAPGNFDAINGDGFHHTKVALPLADIPGLAPFDKSETSMYYGDLVFSAGAGVLADGWSSGGTDHAGDEVKGLVITSLLDNSFVRTLQRILGFLFPSLAPDCLQFGYVDLDAVHPDRLGSGSGSHSCKLGGKDGFCDYEPRPGIRDPAHSCVF